MSEISRKGRVVSTATYKQECGAWERVLSFGSPEWRYDLTVLLESPTFTFGISGLGSERKPPLFFYYAVVLNRKIDDEGVFMLLPAEEHCEGPSGEELCEHVGERTQAGWPAKITRAFLAFRHRHAAHHRA